MKKIHLFITTLVLSLSTQAQVKISAPSPSSKIEQVIGLTDVTLEYSRPSMKGRDVFGNLVPFGKVWRTGANKNTQITFSDDVKVNGNELKKGTYALFTKPGKENWEVIFYSDIENWGTPQEWSDAKVATSVSAKATKLPMKVETFTLMFSDLSMESGELNILWDDTEVTLKIEVPSKATTLASIEKTMAGPGSGDYYNAASFYYEIEDYANAKKHIDKALEMNKEPRFWMYRKKSLIYSKSGDKKGAIKAAKTSLELSTKAGNADYIKMNKDSLKEWGA